MNFYPYYLVDVFTDRAFGGNPLAVFPEADDLTTEQMQMIAQELNLSETTFLQRPVNEGSDCRVRIFTPRCEIPLAGHPTIGTAFVIRDHELLEAKTPGQLVFDLGVGPIVVETGGIIWMAQPLPEFGVEHNRAAVAEALALKEVDLLPSAPVQEVSVGVPFIMVALKSAEAVTRARLSLEKMDAACPETEVREVMVFSLNEEGAEVTAHTRMFAPRFGIIEDPATGSAQGPLGAYLIHHGLITNRSLLNEQGIEMGRPSFIKVEVGGSGQSITSLRVGGNCVEMGKGSLAISF